MDRVYNFSAGPSAMPLPALETAAREMVNFGTSGMSVMEMSHRSKAYAAIFDETCALFKEIMNIPDDYTLLLLQGGATGQFAATAMNLMGKNGRADYVETGVFAAGAAKEAAKYGKVNIVASSKDDHFTRIPELDPSKFDKDADYFYITTNNTIYGTRYPSLPKTGSVPLVADASSNILSEVYDIRDFGVLYAGAQKNIGPAGLVVVIVRNDLLDQALPCAPKILSWRAMADSNSMLNTPPTYAIYMAGLCLKWLKAQGGVAGIEQANIEKAKLLYDVLDDSHLFIPVAQKPFRSRMNVTFRTGSDELDAEFVKGAAERGLCNLKGHRAVGGIRASIYNAMPIEGVRKLADYMKEFEAGRAARV